MKALLIACCLPLLAQVQPSCPTQCPAYLPVGGSGCIFDYNGTIYCPSPLGPPGSGTAQVIPSIKGNQLIFTCANLPSGLNCPTPVTPVANASCEVDVFVGGFHVGCQPWSISTPSVSCDSTCTTDSTVGAGPTAFTVASVQITQLDLPPAFVLAAPSFFGLAPTWTGFPAGAQFPIVTISGAGPGVTLVNGCTTTMQTAAQVTINCS